MDKQQLKNMIRNCHEQGQPVAVSFCAHVPQEILEAAGFCSLRLMHTDGVEDISGQALPSNLCPLVKECYSLCQGNALEEADLILAESSCDGKKKMYELLTRQEQLYYYQIPQGADRSYVNPLIRSECSWLIRTLKERFDRTVSEEGLRQACVNRNLQRNSVTALMNIQKTCPPAAWGSEIWCALEDSRRIADPLQQAQANDAAREMLMNRSCPVPADARRILLTGCPAGGVYRKVVGAIEENGGVVVCFENCEVLKSSQRQVDTEASDIIAAIADCYQETSCAIMAPNDLRFDQIARLVQDYHVDGIVDLALQTCHAYTVERDKMRRFCAEQKVPYLSVETGFTDADAGQIATRVTAFLEML